MAGLGVKGWGGDGGINLREAAGARVVATRVFPLMQRTDICERPAFSKSSCYFVKPFQRCVGQVRLLSWHDSWFANVALL